MKQWLVICLLFVHVFMPADAQAEETVHLELAIWSDNPAHRAVIEEIAHEFVADRPLIAVKVTPIQPYSAFPRTITLRVTGSNPPSLSWMLERLAPQFINAEALTDLRSAAQPYDFGDFIPSLLSLWVRGKEVYGLPFSTSPFFLVYNKDLFARAGVPSPAELHKKGEWTWEHFRTIAGTIKTATGAYAYTFWMDDDAIMALTPILRSYGADAWNVKGRCGLNSRAAVKAMQLFHQMIAIDRSIAPPRSEQGFLEGGAAMAIAQLSMVERLKDAPFAWDVVPLPGGPAGEVSLFGQAAVVVYAGAKHHPLAADFAAFLTNRSNSLKLSRYFPSARASVLESSDFMQSNPVLSPEQMERVVVRSLKNGRVLPSHQNYGKIELIIRSHFERLLQEDADVHLIAHDMCRAIRPYLK